MKKNNLVLPILKWVGGKRQLLPEIKKYLPESFTTYYEPFVGGGALLMELQPKKAVVSDLNKELIDLYKVVKFNVDDLIDELSNEEKYANTAEKYYDLRALDRKIEEYNRLSNIQKAARVIYLNKTCYNGLYRVNSAGEFNSPFGSYKNPCILNKPTLKAVSNYFNTADITFKNEDFASALKGIKKGAFVYFDPPYAPISSTSNFTGYNESGFGIEEQIRLKELCDKLTEKNVKFLLSNSDCEFIRDLYKSYEIIEVKAKRSVNSKADSRGEIGEVLIRNYGEIKK